MSNVTFKAYLAEQYNTTTKMYAGGIKAFKEEFNVTNAVVELAMKDVLASKHHQSMLKIARLTSTDRQIKNGTLEYRAPEATYTVNTSGSIKCQHHNDKPVMLKNPPPIVKSTGHETAAATLLSSLEYMRTQVTARRDKLGLDHDILQALHEKGISFLGKTHQFRFDVKSNTLFLQGRDDVIITLTADGKLPITIVDDSMSNPKYVIRLHGTHVSSWEGLPKNIGALELKIKGKYSLSGIHKIVKQCDDLNILDFDNLTGGLLTIFPMGVKTISFNLPYYTLNPKQKDADIEDGVKVYKIVTKYIPQTAKGVAGNVYDCQEELIDAGFDDLATV